MAIKQTRKQFLKTAASLLAVSAIPFPNILSAATLGRGGASSPNSRLNVACIGLGGKGTGSLKDFLNNFKNQTTVVGLADVKSDKLKSAQRLAKLPDSACFEDFREMLAKGNIDAACISTPDHWHIPAAMACLRAGIAVYVEKPLSLFIGEGRALADLSASLDAKVQVGSQQRSNYPAILRAVRAVKSGRIGTLKKIRIVLPSGSPSNKYPVDPIPPTINYDLWLGPAPLKPYSDTRVGGQFRHITDYSNGMFADWGAHHLDIAQLVLGMDHSGPREVEGSGVFPQGGLFDTPTTFEARYYYPNLDVTIEVSSDKNTIPELHDVKGRPDGIRFEGSEGFVFCRRTVVSASNPNILETSSALDGDIDRDAHKASWINAIVNGSTPNAPAEVGHRSATLCHLAMTAIQMGVPLKWNPDIERYEGAHSELANRYLWRPRRGAWYS